MVTAASNKVVEGRNFDLSTVSASPPSAAHLGLVPPSQPRDLMCQTVTVALGGLEPSLGTLPTVCLKIGSQFGYGGFSGSLPSLPPGVLETVE